MSRPRHELQVMLEDILGNTHVYYQPPMSFRLSYPCIVYEISKDSVLHADNRKYRSMTRYTVTLMDKNPDSEYYEKLKQPEYCSFDRHFVKDNLHHFVFEIYF